MAKRTRAPARPRKKKFLSTSKRRLNTERTRKAAEARRCKFSPELEARGRHLFEETDATLTDIAFELGIHKGTVPDVAERLGWKRYVPPLRDIPPATRILLEAEALEHRREQVTADIAREDEGTAIQPDGGGNDPAPADLVARLRRAVLNELTVVESLRERLKKVTLPLSTVRANDSSFMNPTISTRPSVASWTTAGNSPSSFEKSSFITYSKSTLLQKHKSPSGFDRRAAFRSDLEFRL